METLQKGYTNTTSKELIGKPVVDAYSRTVGTVIATSSGSQNTIEFVGVELNTGEFTMLEAEKAHLDQDTLVIDGSWRTKAETLTNEVAVITRKISALDELKNDVEISEKVHEDMKKRFEDQKKILLEQRRSLSDQLKQRTEAIGIQQGQVYEFVANMKISYKLGEMDEETYKRSYAPFQLMTERFHKEEEDIKFAQDKLAGNLSTLPPEPLKTLPPSNPNFANEPIRLRITENQTVE